VFQFEGNHLAIAKPRFPLPDNIRLDSNGVLSLRTALDEAFIWIESALQNRSRLSG
jgi:hypothetical protein